MTHEQVPRRLLGVALAEPTTSAARTALARAARLADIVELRLDLMAELDLPRLLADRPCPVVATCRAAREGGRWSGTEAARLDVLREAIDLGAEYVDVEADAMPAIRHRGRSRLIASSHDVVRMPDDLPARWQRLADTGADIVKVVGMARDARDVGPVLEMFDAASLPTIGIGMGPGGLATRVLALRSDRCFLTFCSLDDGGGTAPGQIAISELLEVYRARALTARTAVVGLLGPAVDAAAVRRWNEMPRRDGCDAVAVPLLVPDDADVGSILAWAERVGPRVLTVPAAHHETIGQAVGALDATACRAGRVDLLVRGDGGLIGFWTGSEDAALALAVETVTAS